MINWTKRDLQHKNYGFFNNKTSIAINPIQNTHIKTFNGQKLALQAHADVFIKSSSTQLSFKRRHLTEEQLNDLKEQARKVSSTTQLQVIKRRVEEILNAKTNHRRDARENATDAVLILNALPGKWASPDILRLAARANTQRGLHGAARILRENAAILERPPREK